MRKHATAVLGAALAFAGGATLVLASHQFPDVPDSNQFHDDIAWLVDNGIANGYTNGNFGPKDPVSRQAMASFLHNYDTNLGSTEFGVASITVTKGDGLPVPNAAYSIPLGSPIADTTGGVFRFTCDAEEAPCEVAVQAAALSDTDIGGTVRFLPRVLVMKGGDPTAGVAPDEMCEYADGTDGPAGLFDLTKQALAATPAFEDVLIDIGGSADCGIAGPSGTVESIVVPEGFYNVHASFAFFTPDE